ncbi:XkdX family protein [Limosilactobacillus reuteri]
MGQYVGYNAITADQFKEITIEYTNKERNKLLSVDYKP